MFIDSSPIEPEARSLRTRQQVYNCLHASSSGSDAVYNGHAYRIVIEKANALHPEGSQVGVYTGDPTYKEQVWIHTALPFETDEDLSRQAHEKAKAHALARP
jgi:hypothetical protein